MRGFPPNDRVQSLANKAVDRDNEGFDGHGRLRFVKTGRAGQAH